MKEFAARPSRLQRQIVPPLILGSSVATALLSNIAVMEPVSISQLPGYHLQRHAATQFVIGRLLANGLVRKYWNRGRTYREAPTVLTLNHQHPVIESIISLLRSLGNLPDVAMTASPALDHLIDKADPGIPELRTLFGTPKRTLILAIARAIPGIRSGVLAQVIAANDLGRIRPLQSLIKSGLIVTGRPSDFRNGVRVGNNRLFGLRRSEHWSVPLDNVLDNIINLEPYVQSKCAAALVLQSAKNNSIAMHKNASSPLSKYRKTQCR